MKIPEYQLEFVNLELEINSVYKETSTNHTIILKDTPKYVASEIHADLDRTDLSLFGYVDESRTSTILSS